MKNTLKMHPFKSNRTPHTSQFLEVLLAASLLCFSKMQQKCSFPLKWIQNASPLFLVHFLGHVAIFFFFYRCILRVRQPKKNPTRNALKSRIKTSFLLFYSLFFISLTIRYLLLGIIFPYTHVQVFRRTF